MKSIFLKSLFIIGIFFINLSANTFVGATKGNFKVEQGAANYSLDIKMPKGVNNLQANLSIIYNSNDYTKNGLLGLGFKLNGLSQISKCNEKTLSEKQNSSKDYSYCLDGTTLVLQNSSDTYGSNTEYKTILDTYTKIEKETNGWTLQAKNGRVFKYGKTVDSKVGEVFYKINQIKDRYDNKIDFIYSNNHIKEIIYSNNKIIFNYEDRADDIIFFQKGEKIDFSERLKSIVLKTAKAGTTNYEEISNYVFTYGEIDSKSTLRKITETQNGNTLEPIIFNWENSELGFSDFVSLGSFPQLTGFNTPWLDPDTLHDIDGDGDLDIFLCGQLNQPSANDTFLVMYNNEATFSNSTNRVDLLYLMGVDSPILYVKLCNGRKVYPGPYWAGLKDGESFKRIDLNGDGKKDILIGNMLYSKFYKVYINQGNKFSGAKNWGSNATHNNQYLFNWSGNSIFKDINGDSLKDRVHHYNYNTGQYANWVQINTGNGFSNFENWGENATNNNQYIPTWGGNSSFIDINGDGLEDRVHHYNYTTNKAGYWVQLNTGKEFGEFISWGQNTTNDNQYLPTWGANSTFKDVNGDGLPDRIHHYNYDLGEYGYWVQLNNGREFGEFQNWGQNVSNTNQYLSTWSYYSFFTDLDADGLPDRIHNSTDKRSAWIQKNNSTLPKLISITNNRNQNIDIEYSSLKDIDILKVGQKLKSKIVVKNFKIDNGIGGKIKTSFTYSDLIVDNKTTFVGFKNIESIVDTTNTKVEVEYENTFPYAGLIKNIKTYINNKLIADTSNEYDDASSNSNISQVYLKKSISTSYDYDTGTQLKKEVTENTNIDDYGNIKDTSKTITGDNKTYKEIISKTYDNDESNWLINKLTDILTTYTKTGQDDIVKTLKFTYYSNGNIQTKTIEPNNTNALKSTYTYDSFGNIFTETISATGIDSRITKYFYDDSNKNVEKITNAENHIEIREYDINDNIAFIKDPNNLITRFTYDEIGRKTKQINPDGTYIEWTYSWDDTILYSLYKITEQSFDKNDNSLPKIVTYYDILDRKIRNSSYGFDGTKIYQDFIYNDFGKLEKESMPYLITDNAKYIEYEYDDLGREIKLKKPAQEDGLQVEYVTSYDKFTITKKDPKSNSKKMTYDVLGMKIKVEEGDSSDYSYIEYEYDTVGNLLSTTDSLGNKIDIEYDIFGNKIYMNDPDMGIWDYTYYPTGEIKTQTDAKGQKTEFKYDKLGRKTLQEERSSTNNSIEKSSEWIYDTLKNGYLSSEKSSNGMEKRYIFDNYSMLKKETSIITEGTSSSSYIREFDYDDFGRVDSIIEPNGFKLLYTYNQYGYFEGIKKENIALQGFNEAELNHIMSENLSNRYYYLEEYIKIKADIASYEELLTTYANSIDTDTKNEITTLITHYSVIANEYLDLAESVKAEFNRLETIYINNRPNSDSYNSLLDHYNQEEIYYENLSSLINSNSQVLVQDDSQAQNIANEILNYKNDLNAKKTNAQEVSDYLIEEGNNSELLNFTQLYKVLKRDAFGRETKFLTANGVITKNNYLVTGELESTNTGYQSSSAYLRDLNYNYDENFNLTNREDNKLNVSHEYSFDRLDRVTDAIITTNSNSETINYTYDEIGNIQSKTGIGTYNYNNSRPHAVSSTVNSGSIRNYIYDANGNMTNNNGTTINYTTTNKPKSFEKGSKKTEFKYDMNDERYLKINNSYSKTHYVGKTYEKKYHNNGIVEDKYYIYVNNKVVSIATKTNTTLSVTDFKYLYYDNLGSVDTIINSTGVVEQRIAYKPFGERLALDKDGNSIDKSLLKTNRGYTGHEHLEEFDFIHMNGRVYDPIIGRFLSADPNIFHPFDTQDFNRYSYTRNNPLKYTDPSGYSYDDEHSPDEEDFDNAQSEIDSTASSQNDNQAEENYDGGNNSEDVNNWDREVDKNIQARRQSKKENALGYLSTFYGFMELLFSEINLKGLTKGAKGMEKATNALNLAISDKKGKSLSGMVGGAVGGYYGSKIGSPLGSTGKISGFLAGGTIGSMVGEGIYDGLENFYDDIGTSDKNNYENITP